jgi:hypothetical protein
MAIRRGRGGAEAGSGVGFWFRRRGWMRSFEREGERQRGLQTKGERKRVRIKNLELHFK